MSHFVTKFASPDSGLQHVDSRKEREKDCVRHSTLKVVPEKCSMR